MESKSVEKTRPVTITTASLALIVFGAVTLLYVVLVAISLLSRSGISDVAIIVVGVVMTLVVIVGLLDIVAGYGLWHMKRWAAVMGMLLAIFGMMVESFMSLALGVVYSPYGYSYLSYGGFGYSSVGLVLIILIAVAWKSFEPPSTT